MADGTLKAISEIRIGDWVLATNPKTDKTQPRQVTDVIVGTGHKQLVRVIAAGQQIIATDNHPFYTNDQRWTNAAELDNTDTLLAADGTLQRVSAIIDSDQTTTVYNLTVDADHTYYAGHQPVLVHNCAQDIPATQAVRPSVTDTRLGRALADDFRGGPNPIGDGSALDAARHTVATGDLVGGSTHLEKAVEMRNRYGRFLRRGGLNPADEGVVQQRFNAYRDFVDEHDLDAMMRARGR